MEQVGMTKFRNYKTAITEYYEKINQRYNSRSYNTIGNIVEARQ
jgi:hypothetical protein